MRDLLLHLREIFMPSLRNYSSIVGVVFDSQQQLASLLASKMKIGKAPALLKKAVTLCKSKTSVLAARFLVLASLHRRMVTVGAVSHRIQALVADANRVKGARVDCHKALVVCKVEKTPAIHGGEIGVNLSHQLALFNQENEDDTGCPDWTLHPIFNDNEDDNNNDNRCYTDECQVDGDEDSDDYVLLDACYEDDGDEPTILDVIRTDREVEGLEFNIDDEIDQAADMFITRFRKRMNQTF